MDVHITVNGKESVLREGSTLADLLMKIDIDPLKVRGVAIAVNEAIVRKSEWDSRELKAGDEVEMVTAHQGG